MGRSFDRLDPGPLRKVYLSIADMVGIGPRALHSLALSALVSGLEPSRQDEALFRGLRSAHDQLQVWRYRHFPEGTDVGAPGIARGDQAKGGFRGGSEDTENLPCDFPPLFLAHPPSHHQDVCSGMEPCRILPEDMCAFQVLNRSHRITAGFRLGG